MIDVLFVAVIVTFFALSSLLVSACERILAVDLTSTVPAAAAAADSTSAAEVRAA